MSEAARPWRPDALGWTGPSRRRAVDYGVTVGRDREEAPRPVSVETRVYRSRPRRPLPDALSETLGVSGTDVADAEATDWSALWRRPVLVARLTQAFADFAISCRAGRIVARGPADLNLAAAVSSRLGLPLETAESADEAGTGGESPDRVTSVPPGRPFLVACMLHDREAARIGRRLRAPEDVGTGAVVVRITEDVPDGLEMINMLSIIEL